MSSSMLEQAIIDAKELKESAQRNAEETIVEKYQSEIKEAVEKILEQDDLGLGAEAGLGGDLGVAATGKPESASQPEAGNDQVDMVLEQLPFIQTTDDNEVIELDLGKLEESLNIGNEEDAPLDEEIELDEDLLDEYMLDEEFELDEDMREEEFLDEEFELDEDLDEAVVDLKKIPEEKVADLVAKALSADDTVAEDLSLEEMIAEALEEMLSEREEAPPSRDEIERQLPPGLRKQKPLVTGPKPRPKRKKRLPTEKEIDDMFGQNIDEDLFEIEDLEEAEEKELKNPKKADLNKDGKLSSYERNRGAAVERSIEQQNQVAESKKLQRENKTLIKEQTRMSSKVQLLENKLDKYGTVIDQLKQKLDESNLASAKLLYQNRVLDSVSLNERQKNRIVEAIKDAGTVEEAKIIFETLQSTVETAGKSGRKKESLDEVVYRGSSAFMPLKEEKQKVSDPFVARMKTLAGLK